MAASPLRRGDIVRIRDQRWTVSRLVSYPAAALVHVHGCDRSNRGVRTRFLLPSEPCKRIPAVHATRVVSPRRWRRLARQTLAAAAPSYGSLRTLAAADLAILPFQLEPALAVVRGLAARLSIADEVGLGKTVQAGLIVAETLERTADARALVVAPAGLREQWAHELRARFRLTAAVLDSASVVRPGTRVIAGANPWAAHPLVITSVDYVKRPEVLRALETLVWDVVVFDEAHRLSGRSDRHAAAAALADRARTLVLLTATPHSGDDDSFARLCGIGDLERQFPLLVFRRTRRDAGLTSVRKTTWLRVDQSRAEREMHRALLEYARRVWRQTADASAARLAMMVLARRACSSAASLARSIERRAALLADGSSVQTQLRLPLGALSGEDDEPGAELAAPGLADAHEERRTLDALLRLARLAQHGESKLEAIRRLLRRTREPAIVFTEYRDTLAPLAAALAAVETGQLHGGLDASQRAEVLQRFASGRTRVLLATDAASEGLNLQHRCRLVIDLELPWTPLRLEQRVGRVDRIGQPRRVHQVHLVAAGTSEESVVAPLVRLRMARVEQALAAMRALREAPPLEEREVAHCVLSGDLARTPRVVPTVDLPGGIFTVDLRSEAAAEADRAATARVLGQLPTRNSQHPENREVPEFPQRPFVAAIRRRASRRPERGFLVGECWAFRLEFCDASDELLWEATLGIAFHRPWDRLVRAGDIRRRADSARRALLDAVSDQHVHLCVGLAGSLRLPLATATARERAIAAAAERHHARLGAALVQPALFDRRAEREAAVQAAALEETLRRCRTQLLRLSRCERIVAGAAEPAFALIRR